MACYRVTVLGSKRTGKTAMCHYLVTASSLAQYTHTEEKDMRYVNFCTDQLSNCFLMVEDTPGWSPGDRKDDFPDLLTETPMTYVFAEDGVKKANMPPPPSVDEIPWWAFWDEGIVEEPPPEDDEGDEQGSPLDGKGDALPATSKRQAFIVVYSVKDESSFKEAEELVAELMSLMEPPVDEGGGGGDEGDEKKKINTDDVELPPQPIVICSTHNDLKKADPRPRVDAQAGSDLANGFGLPFFECNVKGLGVKEAFEAAILSIQGCERNMTFDKAPGTLARCKAQCCTGCPEECCYPAIVVEKACPNGEQPKHPCRKEQWDKKCCWKNA